MQIGFQVECDTAYDKGHIRFLLPDSGLQCGNLVIIHSVVESCQRSKR